MMLFPAHISYKQVFLTLSLCSLYVWISQYVTALHNDDIVPLRHHQHAVTDGVDVVTWTIIAPDIESLDELRNTSVSDAGPTLACNISSVTSEKTSKPGVLSDKKTIKLHKDLCISHSRKKRAIIAPGTNWCGAGNVAEHRDDLGPLVNVDKCCRDHDHCPLAIEGFSRKFGLYNRSPFTMSSCVCDDVFMSCLNSIGTLASNLIGSIFFNILPSKCIDFSNANRGDTRSSNAPAFIRDNPPFKLSLPNVVDTIQQMIQG